MNEMTFEELRLTILRRTINRPEVRKKILRDTRLNIAIGQPPVMALKRAAIRSGITIR